MGYSERSGSSPEFFRSPARGLLLVVRGDISKDEASRAFPYLHMVSDTVTTSDVGIPRAAKAVESVRIASASAEENRGNWWRVDEFGVAEVFGGKEENGVVAHDGVVVEREEERLRAELALASGVVKDEVGLGRPFVVVASVFGVPGVGREGRAEALEKLGGRVREMKTMLDGGAEETRPPVLQVVFTGQTEPVPRTANEAQVMIQRRQLQKGNAGPFRGSDYVLMFWVIIFFGILTIVVILCIPWAPALDPALKSALKTDSKRE